MLYVNDDTDELFRRAADDYPLNTDGAEWEKVYNQLPGSNLNTPGQNLPEPKIGIGYCCYYYSSR